MRGQPPAHNPGLPLAGQPVRRMRRTHARPSVPRAKTKAFLHMCLAEPVDLRLR